MNNYNDVSLSEYIMSLNESDAFWEATNEEEYELTFELPDNVATDILKRCNKASNEIDSLVHDKSVALIITTHRKDFTAYCRLWISGSEYTEFNISQDAEQHLFDICDSSYVDITNNRLIKLSYERRADDYTQDLIESLDKCGLSLKKEGNDFILINNSKDRSVDLDYVAKHCDSRNHATHLKLKRKSQNDIER